MLPLPVYARLVQRPKVEGYIRPGTQRERLSAMSRSNRIVVGMLLLIIGAAIFSIVQDMARQAQFAPVCLSHGWHVTDTGPLQQPKCLDTRTGLMYVPPEMFNR